jgi:hypothetical protein
MTGNITDRPSESGNITDRIMAIRQIRLSVPGIFTGNMIDGEILANATNPAF